MRKTWVGVLLKALVGVFLVLLIPRGHVLRRNGREPGAYIAAAAFMFVCQFLLSWGHVDAHGRTGRHVGLAAPLLVATFGMFWWSGLKQSWNKTYPAVCLRGIYAGAVTASRMPANRGPLLPRARQ